MGGFHPFSEKSPSNEISKGVGIFTIERTKAFSEFPKYLQNTHQISQTTANSANINVGIFQNVCGEMFPPCTDPRAPAR